MKIWWHDAGHMTMMAATPIYGKKAIEKQWTGTGAIKRQIPLLKPKREINKYYK